MFSWLILVLAVGVVNEASLVIFTSDVTAVLLEPEVAGRVVVADAVKFVSSVFKLKVLTRAADCVFLASLVVDISVVIC